MKQYTVNEYDIDGKSIGEVQEILEPYGYNFQLYEDITSGKFTPKRGERLAVANLDDEGEFSLVIYGVDFFNGVDAGVYREDKKIFVDTDGNFWDRL